MAKFNSYLLGKMRNSVGNVTTCYVNKQNIAKAKIFARKDVKTPEILAQRAKMAALTAVIRRTLPVIRKGFAGVGKGSPSNAFTSVNMAAVLVDENYAATIDYEHLLMGSGMLYPPKVSVEYNTETKKYIFSQETQESEEGFALTTDKVYAVLIEETKKRTKLVALRERGESGSTSYALPEDWDAAKVHAYCFATTKNGKSASDSSYLIIA